MRMRRDMRIWCACAHVQWHARCRVVRAGISNLVINYVQQVKLHLMVARGANNPIMIMQRRWRSINSRSMESSYDKPVVHHY